jgi:hypothetical protein
VLLVLALLLTCTSQCTYQSQGVEVLGVSSGLEGASQLEDLGILLGRGMARMAALSGWGDGGKVVVVVFGVQWDLAGRWGSHIVLLVCRKVGGIEALNCSDSKAIGGGVRTGEDVEVRYDERRLARVDGREPPQAPPSPRPANDRPSPPHDGTLAVTLAYREHEIPLCYDLLPYRSRYSVSARRLATTSQLPQTATLSLWASVKVHIAKCLKCFHNWSGDHARRVFELSNDQSSLEAGDVVFEELPKSYIAEEESQKATPSRKRMIKSNQIVTALA